MAYQVTYKLSLCLCCMYVLANGEGCSDEHGTEDYPEPLCKLAGDEVTLGLLYSEHNEGCLFKRMGSSAPNSYECDCERLGFCWTPCDGCGSSLGGDRHAATGWVKG